MKRNRGFTIVELVVVLAVLAVLAGILVPQYIQYVETAKEGQIKQEAGEIDRAAHIALTRCLAYDYKNTVYENFTVSFPSKYAAPNSKFLKDAKCSRLTNYWLNQNMDSTTTQNHENYALASEFISVLGFAKHGSKTSSIPISNVTPGPLSFSRKNMVDGEAAFQVMYKRDASIATEYYRNGYFVRIEGGDIAVEKLKTDTVPFTRANQQR